MNISALLLMLESIFYHFLHIIMPTRIHLFYNFSFKKSNHSKLFTFGKIFASLSCINYAQTSVTKVKCYCNGDCNTAAVIFENFIYLKHISCAILFSSCVIFTKILVFVKYLSSSHVQVILFYCMTTSE